MSNQLFYFQVLNDTLNPVWNQTFEFVVEDGLHELLILEVYDHDIFGKVIYSYINVILMAYGRFDLMGVLYFFLKKYIRVNF